MGDREGGEGWGVKRGNFRGSGVGKGKRGGVECDREGWEGCVECVECEGGVGRGGKGGGVEWCGVEWCGVGWKIQGLGSVKEERGGG